MSSETQLIEDFIAAWNRMDIDAVMSFFADDAVYHNMPMAPMRGTQAIKMTIDFFVKPAEAINWEILHIAHAGNVVLTERIDRFTMQEKDVALPVMGAFEITDGKITAWRDYFDMATWQKQNT